MSEAKAESPEQRFEVKFTPPEAILGIKAVTRITRQRLRPLPGYEAVSDVDSRYLYDADAGRAVRDSRAIAEFAAAQLVTISKLSEATDEPANVMLTDGEIERLGRGLYERAKLAINDPNYHMDNDARDVYPHHDPESVRRDLLGDINSSYDLFKKLEDVVVSDELEIDWPRWQRTGQ